MDEELSRAIRVIQRCGDTGLNQVLTAFRWVLLNQEQDYRSNIEQMTLMREIDDKSIKKK